MTEGGLRAFRYHFAITFEALAVGPWGCFPGITDRLPAAAAGLFPSRKEKEERRDAGVGSAAGR